MFQHPDTSHTHHQGMMPQPPGMMPQPQGMTPQPPSGMLPRPTGMMHQQPGMMPPHPGMTNQHPGNIPLQPGRMPPQPGIGYSQQGMGHQPQTAYQQPETGYQQSGATNQNQGVVYQPSGMVHHQPARVSQAPPTISSQTGVIHQPPGMVAQPPAMGFPPTGMMPPQQGMMPPQPGVMPPQSGMMPPQLGVMPPQPGVMSPQPGVMPPQAGMMPPQSGMMPPQSGMMPPQAGMMPPQAGMMPPQPGMVSPQAGMMPPQPGMMPAQPGKQRLDPDMMPSVVQVIEDDKVSRSGVFPTGFPTAELPPLVSTEFIAQDQGNCNPKFMRSTIYAVPQNQEMAKNSCIPLSLAITPFSDLHPQEISPPVVDLGESGPVRCQRCKAYMCPFMEFIDGGRKFRCPFCKAVSTVEDTYFAHLDHTGRRTDISFRPELYLGSYEFVATKEYCKNNLKPKEPAFIFMLDVSYNAIRHGLVELFCRNIVDVLRSLPRDYGMDKSTLKIGFATYDNVIHFYKLGEGGARPSMLVVTDTTDIFAPLADGFLVDFDQAESSLVSCLREIVRNFSDTRITETLLGPVIQAGLDALKSVDRAGKLFIFHTSLPTLECPGQLKNREDRQVLGSDKEKTVLSPANDFYTKLGENCVKYACSVDLFFFPNSFIDVASIAPVANLSGGSIYKYQYFDHSTDGKRFLNDLRRCISRHVAFDVMMRVRTSTGIRPTGFYGSFYMQNTTDIEVSAVDSDKSIQVEMKYDDKLDEKEPVYFQTAVLFTSCGGQRRLRIHNLSLPASADYNFIYRMADEDAVIAHLFKNAEQMVREKAPKEMRDDLITNCAHILATYREKCSEKQAPMSQLILPECLKLLPVHVNCILKNDSLNGGSELTVDDRAWMMSLVPSMTVSEVSRFLYPRVYAITHLGEPVVENGGTQENGSQNNGNQRGDDSSFVVPTQMRASIDYFQPEEAYLIENGMVAFVWVGQNVPAQWLQSVFNVNAIHHLDSERHELPENENAPSRAIRHLLAHLNAGRPRHLKLFIIKQHDGLESWMKKFLVEDRYAANSNTYIDFLCFVHREIRNLLS